MSFGFFCLEERFEEDLRCKTVMRVECWDGGFECKRADGGGGANINCDEAEAQKRKGKDERERALVVST